VEERASSDNLSVSQPPFSSDFIAELVKLLGQSHVLTERFDCQAYDSDWTKIPGDAHLVARPGSTAEVSQVLALCSRYQVAVVPSGGRTGLAGGATVKKGQLALSLNRLNRLGEVDRIGRTITVQAGVTVESVHQKAKEFSLTWPIDLASKGTATIGGNLSTNAGGVRVIRYGMTRKWVTAIEAVLMSGEIIRLNDGLEKNNTGYDLLQLLIGAEGTLAVVTEATLKLTKRSTNSQVFFFHVPSLEKLNDLLTHAWAGPFQINAFEFLSQDCLKLVQRNLKRGNNVETDSPFYVLMEVEPFQDDLTTWMEATFEKGYATNGAHGQSPEQQKELWSIREGITESIAQVGPVVKYDVAVPVKSIAEFLNSVRTQYQKTPRQFDLYLFGHYGDGSPHLNLVKQSSASQEAFEASISTFEKELFPLLKQFKGSASSEHGVGVAKKHWVKFSRTPTEMNLFAMIKRSFDPKGLLNPGKIIDLA
jgi:FAD/FMN-containing dehydrogenase